MKSRKIICFLAVGTVLSFAAAFEAAANPVIVSYADVANQCVDPAPANVNLTEELGPPLLFDVDERISIPIVALASVGDCAIASNGDGKVNDGCPTVNLVAESGAQCDNNLDDDFDTKVNDGCPAVGTAESGAQCANNVDDDSNDYSVTVTNTSGSCWEDVFVVAEPVVWVNDGCPAVGIPESGAECLNAVDDDGDSLVNDGCPPSGIPESGAQCANNTDDDPAFDGFVNDGCDQVGLLPEASCADTVDNDSDGTVNDGCPQVGTTAESGPQCNNATDDDPVFDGLVNDGCPSELAHESGAECLNATDDDGDLAVNDGCPQVGAASETGADCTNADDDDPTDDPDATTFDNWDGTIGGLRAKKLVAKTWGNGDTLSFRLMNVSPNVPPLFFNPGVGSASSASNFSIVANRERIAQGACCAVAGSTCQQLTECQCKDLGKDFVYRGDGTPCGPDGTCIPTVSEWGLLVMAVLVLTAATVVIMRRRAMVHGGS